MASPDPVYDFDMAQSPDPPKERRNKAAKFRGAVASSRLRRQGSASSSTSIEGIAVATAWTHFDGLAGRPKIRSSGQTPSAIGVPAPSSSDSQAAPEMRPRQVSSAAKVEASQIRGARAMLGWTQKELAVRSGVAKRSIAGLELGTSTPKPETLERLVATLSAGGIEFRNADADGVGIKLFKTSKFAHGSKPRFDEMKG
ncbi:helix-turn-helix domain-containing protein [Methylobacterium sp.]|nr:helix-turn-helix transcriptional regulator [Methylobacterium sp.]